MRENTAGSREKAQGKVSSLRLWSVVVRCGAPLEPVHNKKYSDKDYLSLLADDSMEDLHALIYGSHQTQDDDDQADNLQDDNDYRNNDYDDDDYLPMNISSQSLSQENIDSSNAQTGTKRKRGLLTGDDDKETPAAPTSASQRNFRQVPTLLQSLYPTTTTTGSTTTLFSLDAPDLYSSSVRLAPAAPALRHTKPPPPPPHIDDDDYNLQAIRAARQERRRAQQRRAERQTQIKRLWQKRRYNLTQEEDVGGAVGRAIYEAVMRREERAKKQKQKKTKTKAKMGADKDKKKKDDDDKGEDDQVVAEPAPPEPDYWQLGKTVPDRVEIDYKSLPPLLTTTTPRLPVKQEDDASVASSTATSSSSLSLSSQHATTVPVKCFTLATFRKAPTASTTLATDPNYGTYSLYPLRQESAVATGPLHRRFLYAVTARAVFSHCASTVESNDDTSHSTVLLQQQRQQRQQTPLDRLLILLWKPPPHKDFDWSTRSAHHVDRHTLHQHQVEWQANHWQFYLEHFAEWNNHEKVVKELGLKSFASVVPSLVGNAFGSRAQIDKANINLQNRLLELYGTVKKAAAEEEDDEKYSALVPTVSYYFVPGSVPPTPTGPLDPTGVVFGPVDKYNHVHYHAQVNESIYQTTLAALLSRYAAARLQSDCDDDVNMRTVQEQIHCMALEAIKLNQNNRWKAFVQFHSKTVTEVPLAQFARAVEGYCSLVANNILPASPSSYSQGDGDYDSDGEDKYKKGVASGTGRSVPFLGEGELTPSVYDLVEQWKDHNGLQLFSNLQVTFGLFRIAQALPDAAAEMLSRPLDNVQCRTPMERIQQVLEFMESMHMLTSVDVPLLGREHNVIHVSELEYALHQAGDCFAKAIERDPVEPSHYAWYLAVSAGSLLLCSGNRVDSEARLYPSFRINDKAQHAVFGSFEDSASVANHEVRRQLPKFEALRRQTARALQLVTTLAEQQRGTRSNLLVSSFLEWRQIIALLAGPQALDTNDLSTIQCLHEHYASMWAIHESSTLSLMYLRQGSIARDQDKLESLATALERDPCVVEHWINLADKLGPFTQPTTNSWVVDRKNWWADLLLSIPFSIDDVVDHGSLKRACRAWKRHSPAVSMCLTEQAFDDATFPAPSDWSWLQRIIEPPATVAKDDKKPPSVRRRCRTYDKQLPQGFREVIEGLTFDGHQSLLRSFSWDDERMLILCCKLILRLHLFGLNDAMIVGRIRGLLLEAWDDQKRLRLVESDACRILDCLNRLGLDLADWSKEFTTSETMGDDVHVSDDDDDSSLNDSSSTTGVSASSSSDSSSPAASSSSSLSPAASSPQLHDVTAT